MKTPNSLKASAPYLGRFASQVLATMVGNAIAFGFLWWATKDDRPPLNR